MVVVDRWDGKYYKKHSKAQQVGALEALKSYSFRGDETILDIGCGDGKITADVAQKVPKGRVLGIDISPSMIREANHDFSHISNLSFQEQDALNIHFHEEFDLIMSFFALHWIQDQETLLRKVKKALKPQGSILFRLSNFRHPLIEEVLEMQPWKNLIRKNKAQTFFPQTKETYQQLLLKTGFRDFRVFLIEVFRTFANLEELEGNFMGFLPHETGLSHEKVSELSQTIATHFYLHQKKKFTEPIDYAIFSLHVEAKV